MDGRGPIIGCCVFAVVVEKPTADQVYAELSVSVVVLWSIL
jgi:ribonuclease HII